MKKSTAAFVSVAVVVAAMFSYLLLVENDEVKTLWAPGFSNVNVVDVFEPSDRVPYQIVGASAFFNMEFRSVFIAPVGRGGIRLFGITSSDNRCYMEMWLASNFLQAVKEVTYAPDLHGWGAFINVRLGTSSGAWIFAIGLSLILISFLSFMMRRRWWDESLFGGKVQGFVTERH